MHSNDINSLLYQLLILFTSRTIMGFFNNLINGGNVGNAAYTIGLPYLPQNLQQLMRLPHAMLGNEYEVATLCIAVLCNYHTNVQMTIEMMNYLRGPRPMSPMEQQFMNDRLMGKPYKMLSYLNGTSPQNNYIPTTPLTVTVMSTPYSYQQENIATLYVQSSGADSPRPIVLRRKPSTGQWFVWDASGLMPDIRIPMNQDPWA